MKDLYYEGRESRDIPDELNTVWRFLGFHMVLAMQKYCQREQRNKGHTLYVFDDEKREEVRFTDIIRRPPEWSDEYYRRGKKQDRLDQIIDIPYFSDSRYVPLIQVADVVAFFLRRYAELKEGLVSARYNDEEQRVTQWIAQLKGRSIGSACMYPKTQRGYAEEIFYNYAPPSIRDL